MVNHRCGARLAAGSIQILPLVPQIRGPMAACSINASRTPVIWRAGRLMQALGLPVEIPSCR
ncbi:hypothetical protein KCP77_03815 [Salmonella enterica subsp. enterica]|nr:hypothetical protein KCP77_03815 [Salmonella enterica subsp. enterica]